MGKTVILRTEFINPTTREKTFGVRVFDDNDCSYDDSFLDIIDDDFTLLKQVIDSRNRIIQNIMDFVEEDEAGIEIDDTAYDWDDIKDCFSDD